MSLVYCVKCKAKTDTINEEHIDRDDGLKMLKGICLKCDSKKCTLLPGGKYKKPPPKSEDKPEDQEDIQDEEIDEPKPKRKPRKKNKKRENSDEKSSEFKMT